MAFKWTPGTPLTADNLNKMNPATEAAIAQNAHNIAELYAQMYLDSKAPDSLGLFFDAFSNETKREKDARLIGSASAGATTIKTTRKLLGQAVITDGSTYDEINISQAVADNTTMVYTGDNMLFSDDFSSGNTKGWFTPSWHTQDVAVFSGGEMELAGTASYRYARVAQNIDLTQKNNFKFKLQHRGGGGGSYLYLRPIRRNDNSTTNSNMYLSVTLINGYAQYYFYNASGSQVGAYNFYGTSTNDKIIVEMKFKNKSVSGNYIYYDIDIYIYKQGTDRPLTPQISGTHVYTYYSLNPTPFILFENYTSNTGVVSYYIDDVYIEEPSPAYDLTFTPALAGSYSDGNIVTRNTANLNTTLNAIELATRYIKKQEKIFSDDFNRTAGNTVGNGWTEYEPATQAISLTGSQIRFGNGYTTYNKAITRTLPSTKKLSIKATRVQTGAYNNNYTGGIYFLAGATNDGNNNGFGVRLRPLNTSGQNNNFEIVVFKSGSQTETLYASLNWSNNNTCIIDLLLDYDDTGKMTINIKGENDSAHTTLTPNATQQITSNIFKIYHMHNYDAYIDQLDIYAYPAVISGNTSKKYISKITSFQQDLRTARLWITRNSTAKYNISTASGSTIIISGDKTAQLATGDTIDIFTADNISRERKKITAIDYNTTNAGQTTITLDSAISGTYTTSDYVERVDVIPEISLVDKDGAENFQAMEYVRSTVRGNETEEEYKLTVSGPGHDLIVKLNLTRNDTSLQPYAKMLAVSLTP